MEHIPVTAGKFAHPDTVYRIGVDVSGMRFGVTGRKIPRASHNICILDMIYGIIVTGHTVYKLAAKVFVYRSFKSVPECLDNLFSAASSRSVSDNGALNINLYTINAFAL